MAQLDHPPPLPMMPKLHGLLLARRHHCFGREGGYLFQFILSKIVACYAVVTLQLESGS